MGYSGGHLGAFPPVGRVDWGPDGQGRKTNNDDTQNHQYHTFEPVLPGVYGRWNFGDHSILALWVEGSQGPVDLGLEPLLNCPNQ